MSEPPAKKFRDSRDSKKKYYKASSGHASHRHRLDLRKGMVGYLITTDGRDSDASREAAHLLEGVCGVDPIGNKLQSGGAHDGSDGDEDIESALSTECRSIKSQRPMFRFRFVRTPVKNVCFIQDSLHSEQKAAGKTENLAEKPPAGGMGGKSVVEKDCTAKQEKNGADADQSGVDDPKETGNEDDNGDKCDKGDASETPGDKESERAESVNDTASKGEECSKNGSSASVEFPNTVCHRLFSKIASAKSVDSRHIQRLVPVDFSTDTRDGLDAVMNAFAGFMASYAEANPTPPTFAIQFKARNNGVFSRGDIIEQMGDIIHNFYPLASANLTNPDISILVNVVQNVVCVGVCRDYELFKKGNLHAIADEKQKVNG